MGPTYPIFINGSKDGNLSHNDVTAYHSKFDADGNPVDPDGEGGLAARFAPTAENVANGYDLSISRYIKHAAAEQQDLPTLIEAYNLARAERQQTEQRMLAVLTCNSGRGGAIRRATPDTSGSAASTEGLGG